MSLPLQGMRVSRRLTEEGIYQVKCDVHGWMQAVELELVNPGALAQD